MLFAPLSDYHTQPVVTLVSAPPFAFVTVHDVKRTTTTATVAFIPKYAVKALPTAVKVQGNKLSCSDVFSVDQLRVSGSFNSQGWLLLPLFLCILSHKINDLSRIK
jgi:hypothetical protein